MANASFYDFHCPLGGQWYACDGGSNFVGCCTSDPCSSTGCSLGNLRAGAFNITHHGEFPDAACGTGSTFWSCGFGDSFWGCCKTDACQATPAATCPDGDLVPAFLSQPNQFDAYLKGDKKEASSDSGKTNTGAIVGGVVGGVVVLAIIGVIIFVVLRRRKNKKTAEGDMGAATMMPMMNKEKDNHNGAAAQYGGQSRMPIQSLHSLVSKLTVGAAPPTYSGPIQNTYQASSPGKGHESYYQYASNASEPQELPAEPAHGSRFSELPAGASNVMDSRRFSELPAESAGPAGPSELESPYTTPYVTPQPLQEEFSNDVAKASSHAPQGLGLSAGK